MALLDDLNRSDLVESKFIRKCGMCFILESVTDEERAKIIELAANPAVAKSRLANVFRSYGYKINAGVVTRHFRGECAG